MALSDAAATQEDSASRNQLLDTNKIYTRRYREFPVDEVTLPIHSVSLKENPQESG